ncbi:MAG: sodium:solute symporter family transporter [Planctomycetota bacterium]|jgi:SSS family transporter
MQMGIADYVIIALYLLLTVGIGLFFSKFMKGGKDYFAGGNKIPWWISGISLYMTNFSAYTFVGLAGFVYLSGWYAFLFFFCSPIAYAVAALVVGGAWRRSRVISPIEYTQTRFNVPTQQSLGWALSICYILTCGAQLLSIAFVVSILTQIPIVLAIIGIGLIVILYTVFAGLWAVTVTDVVQFVILVSIVAVVVPLSIGNLVDGGLSGLLDKIPPLRLTHKIGSTNFDLHYIFAILMATTIGTASGMAPRFYSVVDEKAAKKVGILAGILFLTFPFLFAVPPLVARVIWPEIGDLPEQLVQLRGGKAPQEFVFVAIVQKVLPAGLLGVFLAAMFAATMSALDSFYNQIAAIMSRDVYKGILRPKASDKELLRVGQILTFVIGLIVIGLALLYHYVGRDIFGIMARIIAIFAAPAGVPIAMGLLIKNLPRWSAMASVIWGFIASITAQLILHWNKISLGYQVYLSLGAALFILLLSYHVGKWFKTNKVFLFVFSLLCTAFFAFLLLVGSLGTAGMFDGETLRAAFTTFQWISIVAASLLIGASIWVFGALFNRETAAEKEMVEAFFKKLATPVDVAKEVLGRGQQERSAFFLVGVVSMGIALMICLLAMILMAVQEITSADVTPFIATAAILVVVGFPIFFFGRRYRPEAGSSPKEPESPESETD